MNTPPPFSPSPALRLPRRTSAIRLAGAAEETPAEQASLREDWASLRERELNLRAYEERLRAWQAELDATRPAGAGPLWGGCALARPDGADDPARVAAWEKFHRARQILEAEQAHLRDDRLLFHEAETALRRREAAVAEREARVAERERALRAAETPGAPPAGVVAAPSVLSRLTHAPFQAARAVFGAES